MRKWHPRHREENLHIFNFCSIGALSLHFIHGENVK